VVAEPLVNLLEILLFPDFSLGIMGTPAPSTPLSHQITKINSAFSHFCKHQNFNLVPKQVEYRLPASNTPLAVQE
jgi:hypothetical protein